MRARSNRRALAAGLLLLATAAGARLPELDPNRAEFPDSSLVDFGATAPKHTAEHGFLKVDRNGRFVWENGERARFWGINVAAESVFQPIERIDQCLERIRRAGFNLVRIHHIDGTGRGIIEGSRDSLTFVPEKLRQLDYWVDRCGRLGLAVYLDLLDYRSFVAGDNIPAAEQLGRGAKPYAVFDDDLIAQQQRYARALLRDHVNEFNGRCFADDPAVAIVELFDENGLFIRRRDWPVLVEPYRGRLAKLWNQFLLERYGSSEALLAAWGRSGVMPPLPDEQRLEDGTVLLPGIFQTTDGPAVTGMDKLRRAIFSDAARFAWRVQRNYYRTMREFLRRELRVRVPLTAVGDGTQLPDLLAVAQELDFIGTNFYWDHPIFRANRPWQMPAIFHYQNAVADTSIESFAPKVALARMHRKPLVIREWNYCFPNPLRAAGMVEAAAYAALQDIDAMILFTYGTVPVRRPMGFFDVQADPTRWGLAGITGAIYHSQSVSPARYRVDIGLSEVDTFLYKSYLSEVRNLGWVSRVSNRCFDRDLRCDADLTLASGRSAAAQYLGGPLVLCRNDASLTTAGDQVEQTGDHLGYPVGLVRGAPGLYAFDGTLLLAAGQWPRNGAGRFTLSALEAARLKPVGVGASDAIGFWDAERKVAGFGALTPREQIRVALDLLAQLYQAPVGRDDERLNRFVSDTGELIRDAAKGRLTVSAPRVAALAGDLRGGPYTLGPVRVETGTAQGAFVLLSLDGRPLAETQRFVAKMVSSALNSGMTVSPPGPQNNPRDRWVLDFDGVAPARTNGRPSLSGWKVYRGDELWFAVDLVDGTAEVVYDAEGWRWFVDTPEVRVTVPGTNAAHAVTADGRETALFRGVAGWSFPTGAAFIRAR